MDQKELISQDEYSEYLNRSIMINPYRFVLIFTPLMLILILSDINEFNLPGIIIQLFISLIAILIMLLYINLNQRNNIYRNQNSIIRDKNREINTFKNRYNFCIPVTQRYISDELPGMLYFSDDKITFIANRIIGLKLVWFNLNKLVKGYYDLNFLPDSFESTYKIVELPSVLRFILKHPTKLLIINEKRLNIRKRYIFKIPTTDKIEKVLKKLDFIVY